MLRFVNKRFNNSNSTYLPNKFIFFYTSMDASHCLLSTFVSLAGVHLNCSSVEGFPLVLNFI